jgi:hypothetical protein
MRTFRTIITVFISVFLLTPFFASAAGIINIRTTPEAPGPDTPVSIKLESYVVDLTTSKIVWFINKKPVLEDVGAMTYQFTTGEMGTASVIEVLITTSPGKEFKETLTIRPATVDLLWQANTHVPPFYKGKALPTHRSTIRAVALPQFNPGQVTPPHTQAYEWTLNLSTGLGKGTGMNKVSFEAGMARSGVTIRVKASSQDGTSKAIRTLTIPSVPPEVIFYEDSPVFGPKYNRALPNTFKTKEAEFMIHAVPYFFSTIDHDLGNLVYQWTIDRQQLHLPPGTNKDMTLLKTETESSDGHQVYLKVQNAKRVTQDAGSITTIIFADESTRPTI